jgi:hypothetical protein
MTREQVETMARLLDVEAGAGFTQRALNRLPVLNMIADALREIDAQEKAANAKDEIDG